MCHCVNPHNKIGEKNGREGEKEWGNDGGGGSDPTHFLWSRAFLVSLSSRSVAGSVECIAESDVCIPTSWKPIVLPHAKCYSQRAGYSLRRHEHCFNWLTCSLSIRHRPLVTPAGVYWVCPESFTLNKVTHCSSMQTLIKSVSTLQRSLASAGSDLLYNRAPEIHSRKLLLKDCWMNTSLGHGLFSLNLPVSRLPLCVPVCVRVC